MQYQRFYLERPDCRLSGIEAGEPGKPPMVMVHGMRDHGLGMAAMIRAFADQYHIYALDLRGHGQSDNPGAYSMAQYVADLRALLEQKVLPDCVQPPILVGHSLGGHVVLRYSGVFPESVSQLVLIDGMGPPGNPQTVSDADRLARARQGVTELLTLSSKRRAMASHDDALARLKRNNPLLEDWVAELIIREGVEPHDEGGVQWCWDPAVGMVWQTFNHDDSEIMAANVNCPVLILTGEHSLGYWQQMRGDSPFTEEYYESELARRAGLFQQARHQVIPGAGHMLHYDQPEAVNLALAAFLNAGA